MDTIDYEELSRMIAEDIQWEYEQMMREVTNLHENPKKKTSSPIIL